MTLWRHSFITRIALVCVGVFSRDAEEGNFILNALYDSLSGRGVVREATLEPLTVIGAGFARTGTASLQAALDILGFRSYHMKEVTLNDHSERWHESLRLNSVDIAAAIITESGYNATVDVPGALFAIELARKFPDAKVILTTRREPLKWVASVKSLKTMHDALARYPFILIPFVKRFDAMAQDLWDRVGCSLRGEVDEDRCLEYYYAHNQWLRDAIPGERLLDYRLGQGWEPLCQFLGVPLPSVPFPHINDADGMHVAVRVCTAITLTFYVSPVLLLFCVRACRNRRAKAEVVFLVSISVGVVAVVFGQLQYLYAEP